MMQRAVSARGGDDADGMSSGTTTLARSHTFAPSGTGSLIRCEGWLHKSDPSGGNWKMRFCVCMPQTFCYYKDNDKRDASLQGAFELRNATYSQGWSLNKRPPNGYPFALALPQRTYYFSAASEAERDMWRYHITRTLAELQGKPPPDEPGDAEIAAEEAAEPDPYGGYPGPTPGRTRAAAHTHTMTQAGDAVAAPPPPPPRPGMNASTVATPAPAAPSAEETVTFFVVLGAGGPEEKVFTLLSKAGKLRTMTVSKIKNNLAPRVGVPVTSLQLFVPGRDGFDDVFCPDEWTAADMGVVDQSILTLRVVAPPDTLAAKTDAPGATAVPPPPPPPRKSAVEPAMHPLDADALAVRAGMGRQLTSAGDRGSMDYDAVNPRTGMGRQLTSAGDAEGPESPPRRGQVGWQPDAAAVAARAGMGRQLTSTGDRESMDAGTPNPRTGMSRQLTALDDMDGSASPGGLTLRRSFAGGAAPPADATVPSITTAAIASANALLDSSSEERLSRRIKLRKVFNALAAGEIVVDASDAQLAKFPDAAADARVDRTELAAALGGDPSISSWPEYDQLLRVLLVPGRGARRDLTWEEFSALLRAVQQEQDAAAIKAANAASKVAARSPAVAPVSSGQVAPSSAPAPIATAPAPAPAAAAATAQPLSAPADTTADGPIKLPREHVVVLTVDAPDGRAFNFNVGVGDDVDAIVSEFVQQHGPDYRDHQLVLCNEMRRSLVDAFTLELRDAVVAARNAQARCADLERAVSEARAAAASAAESPEVPELRKRADDAELASAAAAKTAAAANEETAAAKARVAALEAEVQWLTADLEAAAKTAADATAALAGYRSELEESMRRRNTWERYVDGGAAVTAASPAMSFTGPSRTPGPAAGETAHGASTALTTVPVSSSLASAAGLGDWRQWAAEKREILARANADRATLIEENKRLRAALDARGVEAEARLRAADEDRATLLSERHSLQAAREKAEAELTHVYGQWEADGRRWASERKRLQEQVDSLLAAAAMGGIGSTGGSADAMPPGVSGAFAARADVEAVTRWQAEREVILRNWSDEAALLTNLWNKDKSAWTAQRDAILRALRTAAQSLDAGMDGLPPEARAAMERAVLAVRAGLEATTSSTE